MNNKTFNDKPLEMNIIKSKRDLKNKCTSKKKTKIVPIEIFSFYSLLHLFKFFIVFISNFHIINITNKLLKNYVQYYIEFYNLLISIKKTSMFLISLILSIKRLLLKLLFLLIIILMVNFTVSKNVDKNNNKQSQNNYYSIAISKNENFYSFLHQEYSNFLKTYEKNSCIMTVFNKARLNCNDENSDEINSVMAYKMTECYFNSIGKNFPECIINYNSNSSNLGEDFSQIKPCVKHLKKEAWTTFINFKNHIDNLCFFHRSLIWEKSSEFLFSKMFNSTIGILAELSNGSSIAKRILLEQEKFSNQLKDNMTDTLEEFKKIQNFFESFEKLEGKIKNDMLYIEEKINKNNIQLIKTFERFSDNIQNIDGFLFNKNGEFILKYYLFLFIYVWIFAFNSNIYRIRIKLFILVISFFLVEKFIIKKTNIQKNIKNSNFDYNNFKQNIKDNYKDILYENQGNYSSINDEEHIYINFQILEKIKINLITLLNSTFSLDNYFDTNENSYFGQIETYFFYIYLYCFRTLCFIVLNIVCCIQKNSSNQERNKSMFEKLFFNESSSSIFANISNSKIGNITPLWMKKYFSKIEDKNDELLEKFRFLKRKLDIKRNSICNSLQATPNFKN